MKPILSACAGTFLLAVSTVAIAELPAPTAEEKAAAAAKVEKDAAAKAKSAKALAERQDRIAAGYKKNKGTTGADHARPRAPDADLTRREAQTQMPKPGQANDHSTTARDVQSSSSRR